MSYLFPWYCRWMQRRTLAGTDHQAARHVRSCPACRSALEIHHAMDARLRAEPDLIPAAAPVPDLWRRVADRIEPRRSHERAARARIRYPLAAGVAAASLALGYLLGFSPSGAGRRAVHPITRLAQNDVPAKINGPLPYRRSASPEGSRPAAQPGAVSAGGAHTPLPGRSAPPVPAGVPIRSLSPQPAGASKHSLSPPSAGASKRSLSPAAGRTEAPGSAGGPSAVIPAPSVRDGGPNGTGNAPARLARRSVPYAEGTAGAARAEVQLMPKQAPAANGMKPEAGLDREALGRGPALAGSLDRASQDRGIGGGSAGSRTGAPLHAAATRRQAFVPPGIELGAGLQPSGSPPPGGPPAGTADDASPYRVLGRAAVPQKGLTRKTGSAFRLDARAHEGPLASLSLKVAAKDQPSLQEAGVEAKSARQRVSAGAGSVGSGATQARTAAPAIAAVPSAGAKPMAAPPSAAPVSQPVPDARAPRDHVSVPDARAPRDNLPVPGPTSARPAPPQVRSTALSEAADKPIGAAGNAAGPAASLLRAPDLEQASVSAASRVSAGSRASAESAGRPTAKSLRAAGSKPEEGYHEAGRPARGQGRRRDPEMEGDRAFRAGRWRDAVRAYRRARAPGADLLVRLGEALLRLNRPEAARRAFLDALKHNPRSEAARRALEGLEVRRRP